MQLTGLPKLPSLHAPKPFKKRGMTIHGMLRDKLGKLGAAGKFGFLKGIKFPSSVKDSR